MLRVTETRTRSQATILAALIGTACALSLSPAALAAGAKDRDNGRDRRQAEPERRESKPESRRGAPDRGDATRGPNHAEHNDASADSDRREPRPEARHSGPDHHNAEAECCIPSGAGVLRINNCAVQIGNDHKYKKIANSFKDAGYEAFVLNRKGVTSVRVYGFPKFEWTAGKFETHTDRQGSVLEITLCKTGR